MGDGQQGRIGAERGEAPRRATVKPELRWATMANNLDPPPQHLRGMAGAEGFHRRFFGRETTREVDGRMPPPCAVGDLSLGEDTLHKTVAEALDGGGDSRNVYGIHSQTDDVRHG